MSIVKEQKRKKYHWKVKHNTGNGAYTEYHLICAYCTKEVIYNHGNRPHHCPHCGSVNYRKPPTETELFHLQDKYIETRDPEILSKMYELIYNYTKSIVRKTLPSEFTYHYSRVNEKAMDAAHLLIESYLSKPAFRIEQSFAGYLQSKVKEVLWNKVAQKEDSIGSMDVMSGGQAGEDTFDMSGYADTKDAFSSHERDEPSYEMDLIGKEDIVDGVMRLVDRSAIESRKKNGVRFSLLLLLGLHMKISMMSQDHINRFYKVFGSDTFSYMEKILLLIYNYLKEAD